MSQVQYTNFTSFDQPDGAGIRAQVLVTEVTAPIAEVKRGESVTTVVVDHEAAGMQYPFSAHAVNESPWIEELAALAGTGQPVTLRAETKRKAKDKAKQPISRRTALRASEVVPASEALATMTGNTAKALVGVNGVLGPEAITLPAEDRKWRDIGQDNVPAFIDINDTPQHAPLGAAGTAVAAPATSSVLAADQIITALLTAQAAAARSVLEQMASRGGCDPLRVSAVYAQAILDPEADHAELDRWADTAVAGKGQMRSSRLRELQPWIAYDHHGNRNLASYEFTGTYSALTWSESFLREDGKLSADPQQAHQQVAFLANGLMEMADAVQEGLYEQVEGRAVTADRNASTHKSARTAVERALRTHWGQLAAALYEGDGTPLAESEAFQAATASIIAEATSALVHAAQITATNDRLWARTAASKANGEPEASTPTIDADEELPAPVLESVPAPADDDTPAATSAPANVQVPTGAPWLSADLGPMTVEEGGQAPNPHDTDGWAKALSFANLSLTDEPVSDYLIATFGTDDISDVAGPRVSALVEYLRAEFTGNPAAGVTVLRSLLNIREAA